MFVCGEWAVRGIAVLFVRQGLWVFLCVVRCGGCIDFYSTWQMRLQGVGGACVGSIYGRNGV